MLSRLPQESKPVQSSSQLSKVKTSMIQPQSGDQSSSQSQLTISHDDNSVQPIFHQSHWADLAENASLLCSGAGVLASVVLQQSMYASAPLSLALVVGLMNRRRIVQEIQNLTNTSIHQLDQKLIKNVNSLHQRVLTLPTPETLDNVQDAIVQSNREAILAMQTEILRRLQGSTSPSEQQALRDQQQEVQGWLLSADHLIQGLPSLRGNQLQAQVDQVQTDIQTLEERLNHLINQSSDPTNVPEIQVFQQRITSLESELFPKQQQLEQALTLLEQALSTSLDQSSVGRSSQSTEERLNQLTKQWEVLASQPDIQTLSQKIIAIEQELAQSRQQYQATVRSQKPNGTGNQALVSNGSGVNLGRRNREETLNLNDSVGMGNQPFSKIALNGNGARHHAGNGSNGSSSEVATLSKTSPTVTVEVRKATQSTPNNFSISAPRSRLVADHASPNPLWQAPEIIQLLENAETLIVMVLPWQESLSLPSDIFTQLQKLLDGKGKVEIGWTLPYQHTILPTFQSINHRWHTDENVSGYEVVEQLEALRHQYPDQFRIQLFSFHGCFVVADCRNHTDQLHRVVLTLDDSNDNNSFHQVHSQNYHPKEVVHSWNEPITDPAIVQQFVDRVMNPAMTPPTHINYFSRAITRQGLGDCQGAIEDYSQVLQVNTQDEIAFNNRGVIYYQVGALHKAMADFDHSLKLKPASVVYCNRGTIRTDLGDCRGALVDYQTAIELDPHSALAFNNRGLIYSKLGNTQRAIADYNEAISRNPNYALAYFNRGAAHQKLMQRQASIADYTQTIRINPGFTSAYNNRGFLRYELGEFQSAIEDFDQALDLNPQFANAYNNRGVVFSKQKDFQRAVYDFDQAIAINPQFANAYNNRGVAHSHLRNRDQAISDLQNASRCFAEQGDIINQKHTLTMLAKLRG